MNRGLNTFILFLHKPDTFSKISFLENGFFWPTIRYFIFNINILMLFSFDYKIYNSLLSQSDREEGKIFYN